MTNLKRGSAVHISLVDGDTVTEKLLNLGQVSASSGRAQLIDAATVRVLGSVRGRHTGRVLSLGGGETGHGAGKLATRAAVRQVLRFFTLASVWCCHALVSIIPKAGSGPRQETSKKS